MSKVWVEEAGEREQALLETVTWGWRQGWETHSIWVSPMSGALMYQAWNCLFICQQSSCLNYRREKCLLACAYERGQEAVFSEGLLAEIIGSGEDGKGRSWASLREDRGGMARGPPAILGGLHC